MTVSEAARLIAIAVATLPNLQDKELAPTAHVWAAVMPDLDYKTAEAALIRILREKKIATLPQPAELLEAARFLRRHPDDPPPAAVAWAEVRQKLDRYRAPEWSHPLIGEAVRVIGYLTLCESEFDLSTRFMKIYDDLVRRRQIDQENQVVIQITANGKISLLGGARHGG